MSMREQEYVRSTWELAVREGLLPRTPMIEIINALCTNIRKLIDEIRDRGGMIKSDVVWVIIGAVWIDIVGNRQLFEARPSPLQCIRMEEFIHIDTLERIAGGLYISADGVVEALLNAAPGKPNAPSFSSVASSSTQAGGDIKDTAPKTPSLVERVAAARKKNASSPAPSMMGVKRENTSSPSPSMMGVKPAITNPIGKTEPDPPAPTNARAKYGLKSMGNTFPSPAGCGPWAVRLPREVSALEYVLPYREKLGKMLGVSINVGAENKVFIKPHRSEDKTLSDEIIHLQAEYNVRTAYSMLIKWVADMYSTGEAKDLGEFILEDIAKLCSALSKETEISVETVNQLSRSITTVKPSSNPLNFHFFSMNQDNPEKRTNEEEE
ncbi:hypothetical protein PG990_001990 [Apiospora arundinis]|uniref:Uncharacterized protein n=1 Tax=Apiospora arundinis TaxID=335852 RepID=A0ABR2I3G6_9PEZI